jgi:hypothetical protein
MKTASLEERVAELEIQYAELSKLLRPQPTPDAWRSVVGMFADDPEIVQLHREIRRIREEDRQATRDDRQS